MPPPTATIRPPRTSYYYDERCVLRLVSRVSCLDVFRAPNVVCALVLLLKAETP